MSIKNRVIISIYLLCITLMVNYCDLDDLDVINLKKYCSDYMNIIAIEKNYIGNIIGYEERDCKVSYSDLIDDYTSYKEGIVVRTSSNAIMVIEDGVVVNIRNDQELGNVVTVVSKSGFIYDYGFLDCVDTKLYSIVNKKDIIGSATIDETYSMYTYYLSIKKDNEYQEVVMVINEY